MLTQRPFGMNFKRIEPTSFLEFNFLHEIVQHRLRGGLVFRERDAFFDSKRVAISAPPFGGLAFDLLSGLRVSLDDRLLVEAGHGLNSPLIRARGLIVRARVMAMLFIQG
ncbi:MAG: hypothetical protein ACYTGL_17580 [Planctomycetota bacterium]